MKRENLPEELRSASPLISKGLTLLQSVTNRASHDSEKQQQRSHWSTCNSAQAISCYYQKVRSQFKKLTSPNSFVSKMEEMKKAFLMRPGCPQFSTRTTSVSHMGSATMVDLPKGTYASSRAWKVTEDQSLDRKDSDTSVDGHLLASSKSACQLNYPRKRSEPSAISPTDSPTMAKKSQKTRVPWYISVIHEKDHSLSLLGEELQRLSELETRMQKKDQEILMLRKERELLKKQLKSLLRSKGTETSSASIRMDRSFETPSKLGRMSMLKTVYKEDELQHWIQMQEDYNVAESSQELQVELAIDEEKSPEGPTEEARPRGIAAKTKPEDETEETKGAEEEEMVVEEEEKEEEEEMWTVREEEEERPKRSYSLTTESFEEELMAHLEEYERMLMDFQSELELTRTRYSLATGAITSLQRQTDFLESQLRKVTTENDLLEKELRERKQQIQAMTDKFSSLREEKKHQEIRGLIEKENLILRQQVSDLETELVKSEKAIAELHSKTSELQAQVDLDQDHLRRWKELCDDLQSRKEIVQQAEQQTRVVLEASQARLEKFRNKIIQAVYNVSGTKNLSTELSDNSVLESLQKIITERSDFYGQLKQKGVKVPPLQQSDVSLPSKIKKMLSKS
ncbi:coiled-coil domain-containing protein 27 [Acomys russatus]|uniref:coiled-coil domain-containing protein 27 n=1 Tax=Acomys russatus TaxID=60746 RepID=UPI0021E2B629|nr:coiled-coil domain-containing protein 27 [Acomys russatus]